MLHWHAEITFELSVLIGPGRWLRIKKMTLRGYDAPDGYARHVPFQAIAQADVFTIEAARVFLHSMMRKDGSALRRRDYQGIATLLRIDHHVVSGIADRKGKEVFFDVERWAV